MLDDRGVIVLKPGKERAVLRRHPWVFSGAIARAEGGMQSGDTVVVRSANGEVLGRGAYSPTSQIRVRMWTFGDRPFNELVVQTRVQQAVALRTRLVLSAASGDETDSCRLLFAESDGLPGVIVDLYGTTAVLQAQSAGAERIRDIVVAAVRKTVPLTSVFERSDADIRGLEGLPARKGPLWGEVPAGHVHTREHGMRFLVDVDSGHKTGFYLDQRDSRARLRSCARAARVLNCFSYTGGFAIAALHGGASEVLSVDTSQAALDLGKVNAGENGFAAERHRWERGDVFDVLRRLQDEGERFDIVVLDPPKFAPSAAHVEKAARGYKDLMMRGLKLLPPGGLLFTFSCSGAIDRVLFRQLASQAALEARRPSRVLAELGHALCHPVATSFPEGDYLKGLLLVAVDD